MDKQERCHLLMMAEIDGEISPSEKEELQRLLKEFPDCLSDFQSFKQLKEVTNKMALKKPDSEIWETYWYSIYNRIERSLAWLIFTVGVGILIVYGVVQLVSDLWQDTNIPLILKLGIFGTLLGLFILLISVIREKLYLKKNERYKEVQR
ncbi:hypothetical protein JW824_04120 [bacterium]|nr:hypothetical protein [bacterium]